MTKYPNSACEQHKNVTTNQPVCIICMAEELEMLRSLERQYTQRLGEMARLSDLTAGWILKMMGEQPTVLAGIPDEVVTAAYGIMEYVDLVRPGDDGPKDEWVVHIVGPDDVIPCVSQYDALRQANQLNKDLVAAMIEHHPDNPFIIGIAKNKTSESV